MSDGILTGGLVTLPAPPRTRPKKLQAPAEPSKTTCEYCGSPNLSFRENCHSCGAPLPAEADTPEPGKDVITPARYEQIRELCIEGQMSRVRAASMLGVSTSYVAAVLHKLGCM